VNPSLKYAHLFLKVRATRAFSGPPGAYKYIHKASGGQCAVSLRKRSAQHLKGQYVVKTYTLHFCIDFATPPPFLVLYKFGILQTGLFFYCCTFFELTKIKLRKSVNLVLPTLFFIRGKNLSDWGQFVQGLGVTIRTYENTCIFVGEGLNITNYNHLKIPGKSPSFCPVSNILTWGKLTINGFSLKKLIKRRTRR